MTVFGLRLSRWIAQSRGRRRNPRVRATTCAATGGAGSKHFDHSSPNEEHVAYIWNGYRLTCRRPWAQRPYGWYCPLRSLGEHTPLASVAPVRGRVFLYDSRFTTVTSFHIMVQNRSDRARGTSSSRITPTNNDGKYARLGRPRRNNGSAVVRVCAFDYAASGERKAGQPTR